MWTQYQASERAEITANPRLEYLIAAVNQLSLDDYHQLMEMLARTAPPGDEVNVPVAGNSAKLTSELLTKRESEVLTLVASGYSRREIGTALSISENTAACHIASIYRKLDISTIAEATRIAILCGAV